MGRTPSAERGASIVEFSLVALFLLVFLLGVIDFSRFFFARAVLFKGAQMGLTTAKNLQDFAFDLSDIKLEASEFERKKTAFIRARQRIVAKALSLPRETMFALRAGSQPLNADDPHRLARYVQKYPLRDGTSFYTVTSPVLVLRPGDSGQLDGEWIDHPEICSPISPSCPAEKRRTAAHTMEQLLRDYPIIIELRGEVELFFPFVRRIEVRANMAGYKEFLQQTAGQALPVSPTIATTTTIVTTTTTTTTTSSTTTTLGASSTSTVTTTTTTTIPCAGEPPPPNDCASQVLQWDPISCSCQSYGGVGN